MAEMSSGDIAALVNSGRNNDNFFGDGIMGMFGLLILLGLFNGDGFGRGNNGPGPWMQQFATRDQVQQGFDNLNNADAQRDILGAVTTAGTNGIAATKEAQYETIGVIKDVQVALTAEGGRLENQGTSILAKLNECCCKLTQGQQEIKYDALKHENEINDRIEAMERRLTEKLNEDKFARMQREIDDLRLEKAMCGVVRYPTSATYDAGTWPFGGGAARVATTSGT